MNKVIIEIVSKRFLKNDRRSDIFSIGYDSIAGFGPNPYIIKLDEDNLLLYWLVTDGGDWKNPNKIANSLDDFIKIITCLNNHIENGKQFDKSRYTLVKKR